MNAKLIILVFAVCFAAASAARYDDTYEDVDYKKPIGGGSAGGDPAGGEDGGEKAGGEDGGNKGGDDGKPEGGDGGEAGGETGVEAKKPDAGDLDAEKHKGFCHWGIAVWFKPGFAQRCNCMRCICQTGGNWKCDYHFAYCPYYYCGNGIFNPHTQLCCCGKVYDKKSNHQCCGYYYYDKRHNKCCNYYSVKPIKSSCPRYTV